MNKLAFISYRRDDADAAATLLKETLVRAFGDQQIFMDTKDIRMGDKWPVDIEEALQNASVVLVVIERNWLRIDDEYGRRRLDREDDWVRREIEQALAKATVIPVLIGGAELPPKEALPPSIADLVEQQSLDLRMANWDADIAPLIERLEKLGFDRSTVAQRKEVEIASVTALHQLPPPPRDFTGRKDEIDELLGKIQEQGVSISGLQGMGGVGKTTLALKLAERLAASYPDAQFYIELKGTSPQPLTAGEIQAHVIRAYYPTAKLPESEAELSGLYQSVLHGKRALLILDNAKDGRQVEPLIPPSSCALIVTSRYHFTLPGLYAKRLDVLPEKDAEELLLSIAPRIADQAATMAKLCGHLPLALRLAATALAEKIDLKVTGYIKKLEEAQQRLSFVDASVSLSYELLDEQAQKLWRELAVFPNTFDSQAAAAVWGIAEDEGRESLSSLVLRSLVEYNEATNRYRLHDLVRLFADSRLSENEKRECERRHSMHFLYVLRKASSLYLEGGEAIKAGLALFDVEVGNIEAGQVWASNQRQEDEEAARLCSNYPLEGIYVLLLRNHRRENIRWMEAALEAARQLKDRRAEGAHLGNMGNSYRALGNARRSIVYQEQALVISREIGDRQAEGKDLGSLGIAYENLGDSRRAIEYFEQWLVIAREIGDRRGEGQALGNLGNAYATLGNARRAIEYFEQVLFIFRDIGDKQGEGQALGNMGIVYADLGETKRAIEFYEQHLDIAREIGDRRGEGNALFNMSLVLDKLGQRQRAISYAEEALKIFEQIESPSVSSVQSTLAQWREQE